MKYINVDCLRSEIEKERKHLEIISQGGGLTEYDYGRLNTLQFVITFLDSLQQEQPTIEEDWVEKRKQECMCRRLSANGNYQCERYEGVLGPCDGRCSWVIDYPKLKGLEEMKQPDVDLEKEIKSWIQNHVKGDDFEPYRTIKKKVIEWGEFVAHRFYELGKLHQERSDVDLEKESLKYFSEILVKDDETPILCDFKFKVNFATIARHFFELGLNARKEEQL